MSTELTYSDDQAAAFDAVAEMLRHAGIDLDDSLLMPPAGGAEQVMAVTGKAGSGKTLLLAELYRALEAAGVEVISGDYESKKRKDKRTLAILAPTNKAASVLRLRGVPATTIHRILYTPVYDPEYERIAEWLAGNGERPEIEGLTEIALEAGVSTARRRFMRTTNLSPVPWPLPVCAGRISSPAGNGARNLWTSVLWMNPQCWMTNSSKTSRRSFQHSCCSAIRHNWPL